MKIPTLLISLTLSGCATAPWVVPANHPANPGAATGTQNVATPLLRRDADTLRTDELLLEREKQAARAEPHPPEVPATTNTPAPMHHIPGMGMPMDH